LLKEVALEKSSPASRQFQ